MSWATFDISLCLTYLPLGGRAEATRLAFYIGDVEFEDKQITFAEFPAYRPKAPLFKLPTLEVIEGTKTR